MKIKKVELQNKDAVSVLNENENFLPFLLKDDEDYLTLAWIQE